MVIILIHEGLLNAAFALHKTDTDSKPPSTFCETYKNLVLRSGHSCLAFFLPATWSFSPSVRPHGLIMIWAANCRPGSHSANAVAASGHGGSMGTYTSGTKSQWPEQAVTECPF